MSTGSDPGEPSLKGTPLLAPVVKTEALNKKDIAVLTYMDPRWYGREDGYKGTTHQEALKEFMVEIEKRGLTGALEDRDRPFGDYRTKSSE